MDPTNHEAVRVRTGNVRVPHGEFLAIWQEAVRRAAGPDGDEVDRYVDAVAQTCRWMAAVPMRTALCGGLPRSPVTRRACVATEALIEAEWQAAERREGFSAGLAARPGWCDGVRATLRWAWSRDGPPPIELPGPPRPVGDRPTG